MSTRILLVRHGATVLTAEDRFAESTDVPLGEERRQQVQQLAARLATEPRSITATGKGSPVTKPPGLAVLTRARATLDAIVAAHAGEHVLLVSHKATIRLLVADLLGLDTNGYRRRLDQQPASLNILDFDRDGLAQLVLYNDVSHYGLCHGHADLHVANAHRQRVS